MLYLLNLQVNELLIYILHCIFSIVRCIANSKSPIVEGEVRAKELAEYLDNLKATKVVWLSEDATAITRKVVYDPTTNQLIGIVLPHNKTTGCPIPSTFMATDAETIKLHLMEDKSNVVYLVMAQPLDEHLPPFLVQMFGSANKFDTSDMVKRWNFIETELKRLIQIIFITNSLLLLLLSPNSN